MSSVTLENAYDKLLAAFNAQRDELAAVREENEKLKRRLTAAQMPPWKIPAGTL